MKADQPALYGLLGEFKDPESLLAAAEKAHARGYRAVEAYSPMPIHGLAEALGFRKNGVPLIVLGGGIAGAFTGFMMQFIATVLHYPQNIGGRPLFSWPSYTPVAYECTILFAAFSAVIGMIILNKLPMPYHPLFNVDSFSKASQDGFFLCVESTDPLFNTNDTTAFLKQIGALEVSEVKP